MSLLGRWLIITAAVMAVPVNSAFAAPPASCAHKFVGTWVYPGGITTVSANGQAYPKCPMCVAVQSWTCSGNTYLFSNSGPPGQFSATLVGANTMQGSGVVATRVGGRAAAAKQPKSDTPNAAAPTKQKTASGTAAANSSRRQSCSDITGTKGGRPSRANCPPPRKQSLAAVEPTQKRSQAQVQPAAINACVLKARPPSSSRPRWPATSSTSWERLDPGKSRQRRGRRPARLKTRTSIPKRPIPIVPTRPHRQKPGSPACLIFRTCNLTSSATLHYA